jgi:hypothetical protein
MIKLIKQIVWLEPNRANTPPLHIAKHGQRYSTLTGVWWLDKTRFLVNHRSGLRLALFDLDQGQEPVVTGDIPHLTDDIALRKDSATDWTIAVSGCWAASASILRLKLEDKPRISFLATRPSRDASFCHGVGYDAAGDLWLAFHTGVDPRIEVDGTTWHLRKPWARKESWKFPKIPGKGRLWRLPAPWGARKVFFDPHSGVAYAVTVSNNPKKKSYEHAATSIWSMTDGREWKHLKTVENMHSDAGAVFEGKLWLPDQMNDRLVALDMKSYEIAEELKDNTLDFPHGLHISPNGRIAVTNYGNSSISIYGNS